MKRAAVLLGLLGLLAIAVIAGFQVIARSTSQRIQTKIARVQAGMDAWTSAGHDPLPIAGILSGVMPAIQRHEPVVAEALLDRALDLLGPNAPAEPPPPPTPGLATLDGREPTSDLFGNPQAVTIEGYRGDAMEPFISSDTQWLFFNSSNDPKVDTDLHFAIRVGPIAFRYVGELANANSRALDAAPSMDTSRRVYFTSVREYDRTLRSIFTGVFDGRHGLRDVHVIEGTLTPVLPGAINMDVSISPDGQTLYMSRAKFTGDGLALPLKSDIVMARRDGEAFNMEPRSGEIFARINTKALEYAPAISADGLELYFTRASKRSADDAADSDAGDVKFRIMVAKRTKAEAPFDEPRVLDALTGFVEAPSLSLDGREMFFHKKVNGRFVVYRAERKVVAPPTPPPTPPAPVAAESPAVP
jgi:hypothetical protein